MPVRDNFIFAEEQRRGVETTKRLTNSQPDKVGCPGRLMGKE